LTAAQHYQLRLCLLFYASFLYCIKRQGPPCRPSVLADANGRHIIANGGEVDARVLGPHHELQFWPMPTAGTLLRTAVK